MNKQTDWLWVELPSEDNPNNTFPTIIREQELWKLIQSICDVDVEIKRLLESSKCIFCAKENTVVNKLCKELEGKLEQISEADFEEKSTIKLFLRLISIIERDNEGHSLMKFMKDRKNAVLYSIPRNEPFHIIGGFQETSMQFVWK